MRPTQHLPHLLNQRTDRHTTSIRPLTPSSAHKIARPHMGFDAVRPAGLRSRAFYPLFTDASDAKLCMGMSLRANTIHCMRTLTGLLAASPLPPWRFRHLAPGALSNER